MVPVVAGSSPVSRPITFERNKMFNWLFFKFKKDSNYYLDKIIECNSRAEAAKGKMQGIIDTASRYTHDNQYISANATYKEMKYKANAYKIRYKQELEKETGIQKEKEEIEKQLREYGL